MGNCTPGPWKIAGGLSEHSASIDIYSESGLWVGVAHGCHDKTKTCGCPGEEVPGFPTDEEAIANARLIAAVPDLLEAAEGLLGCPSLTLAMFQSGEVTKAVKKLKEVIARATEETS